nr:hypothetical protein [Corynebacterium kefirresidentii]
MYVNYRQFCLRCRRLKSLTRNKEKYLVIDFDCTQATESIPQWAADEGHEIRDFHRSGDAGWQVTVVKGG